MDIITYMDNDGNPIMLFEDSKPSVVMDMNDATVSFEEEEVNDKCYLHIKKENGVSVTIVLDKDSENHLADALFNFSRIRRGLPVIDDVEVMIQEVIDNHEGGRELE